MGKDNALALAQLTAGGYVIITIFIRMNRVDHNRPALHISYMGTTVLGKNLAPIPLTVQEIFARCPSQHATELTRAYVCSEDQPVSNDMIRQQQFCHSSLRYHGFYDSLILPIPFRNARCFARSINSSI